MFLVGNRGKIRSGSLPPVSPIKSLSPGRLPAIWLEALAHILGEGEVGVAIDGDAVVIVEGLGPSKTTPGSFLPKATKHSMFGKETYIRVVSGVHVYWKRDLPWGGLRGSCM